MPKAIAAAGAEGTLLHDRDRVNARKMLIPLHLVRALHGLIVCNRLASQQLDDGAYDTLLEWYRHDHFVAGRFRERTGLDPAGSEALALEPERFVQRMRASRELGRTENLI